MCPFTFYFWSEHVKNPGMRHKRQTQHVYLAERYNTGTIFSIAMSAACNGILEPIPSLVFS